MVGSILLVAAVVLQAPQPKPQSACAQVLADAVTDGATSELCAGEDAAKLANAAPKDSAERARQLAAAAAHYRRAARLASKINTKVLALNTLADSYDAQHLNDSKEMDATLQELIALTPDDLAPVFRLAKSQEDQGLIDAAQDTLLDARRKQPDEVQPNRMLAQFYARRVTALNTQQLQREPQAAGNAGEPDANGVYRIGGSITPPARADVPRYPPEARAAGISGVVVAEIVVDNSGNVTDAKVLRSIPLLDEAALQAVHNWHYAPTMVNGQAVPVRMTVTVNFSAASPTR